MNGNSSSEKGNPSKQVGLFGRRSFRYSHVADAAGGRLREKRRDPMVRLKKIPRNKPGEEHGMGELGGDLIGRMFLVPDSHQLIRCQANIFFVQHVAREDVGQVAWVLRAFLMSMSGRCLMLKRPFRSILGRYMPNPSTFTPRPAWLKKMIASRISSMTWSIWPQVGAVGK